jgi:outer membrane protein assembly factor BamB
MGVTIRRIGTVLPCLFCIAFGSQITRAADWNFPRGDSESSGSTDATLPMELGVAWEFKAEEAIETTPVINGSRVFAADVMGTVYAISRSDGKELWRKSYDTGFLASPVIAGDQLFIGDIDGNVYALAAADGKERWKQTTEGEISGAAAIYQDNVLVASQDGKLYCFRSDTGEPVWVYEADDQIRCSPTIAGDRTFLGGCDAKLHIVDLKTGKASGEGLPLGGPTGSTPAVRGDLAVVPIMDGTVFGFDWKKKTELWRYEDPFQAQEYRNSAAVAGDVAVVSSQRKQVDAIDVRTGKRIWRHTLKRRADASPVISGQDVWIPASDGRLLRLSLVDGTEKWSHEVRGAYVSGVAVTDKELIVTDDDGVVRCFRGK